MSSFLIAYGPLIGYVLLFLGSLLEGETVIITAGYFAFKGFLEWPLVVVIAFLGTVLTDQVLFFIGRSRGTAILERRPKLKAKSKRVFALLHRYQTLYILTFRFIYGIRIASPLILGTSGIPIMRYIVLDLIAASVWCPLMVAIGYGIGYFFHESIEIVVHRLINFEKGAVAIIALVMLVVGTIYYRRHKQAR
jgi:membrane protein DedA with SNARE-associated domain